MAKHEFGGDWTNDKQERVRKYLLAYLTIFKNNPKARYFATTYVDAFAGTGDRSKAASIESGSSAISVEFQNDEDVCALQKGSARIALELSPGFDHYLFIDQKHEHIQDLNQLKSEFPDKAARISVLQGDTNKILQDWCRRGDWTTNRAVVFLDPYGMQVEWKTIEQIARTEAIDTWILFPIGMAVNRLLTRKQPPPDHWASALTRFFGSDDWKSTFYKRDIVRTLFGDEEFERKDANFDIIGEYFLKRLRSVFNAVAPNPLVLKNSTNCPIYLLCFAAGNPRGAPTAVKIAKHILSGD